jgi:hypothetical protein
LDKAGIYLKANPLEPNKDSQEIDDVLSNPETFGREEAINLVLPILNTACKN